MPAIARPLPVALLIGIAVGIAIAVAATTIVSAQSATLSTEVRITARLLENGKVEFGLQQREGGTWGEIILPRVNKFPYATATVDRWLYSSRVAVTATATEPEPGPAPATRAWQRSRWDDFTREYTLVGWGTWGGSGPAGYESAISPHLDVGCIRPRGEPAWAGVASLGAGARHPSPAFADFGTVRLSYRVGDRYGLYSDDATLVRYITIRPDILPGNGEVFQAWLAASYTRSRTLHLDVDADGALYFRATFDLTGLPAVLADLPCYE